MSTHYQKPKRKRLSSNNIAFVAGHFDQAKLTERILFHKVNALVPGVFTVRIPSRFWKGFGFVHFKSRAYLKKFLSREQIYIDGKPLVIKEHFVGKKLRQAREDYHDRRIFVRLLAHSHVTFDLMDFFRKFGAVEKAFFVPESEIDLPGKYTIIGYVLFNSKKVARQLINRGQIEF